jgi:hypothetical protein
MKSRLLALLLLIAGAFYLTWVLTAPENEQEFAPPPPRPPKSTTSSTPPAPVAAPKIDPRSIDPEIQKLADRLAEQTQTPLNDLETLGEFIDIYRKSFSQLPVGSNEDLTAILTGQNPKKGVLFPPDSPMIIKGQLVDRWGTPYWLHPNSGASLEVRSAGPDKNLFTADDVILNPSPGGLGVTPEKVQ